MTEGVWIAIIGVLGVISTAASGVVIAILTRQHSTVKRVDEQVTNSHGTNFRHDLDVVRDEGRVVGAAVDRIERAVASIIGDVRGIRRDVGRLDDRDVERGREMRALAQRFEKHLDDAEEAVERIDEHDTKLDHLEHTLDPRKDTP
ncbi:MULTISPECIES: DUF2746 domain-containing protein [unclassified Leucobacter]|uniref:DUF2746 domain-containing protein n=1 Tax=unclassified Leucobacter TaxID=2621730 RepID=UPI000622341D|nr:DUF2746 domain-containing protein [Leucobacter sp. Ag1]KKI16365.1 hypothetical protein XM48_16335 [Leucobacter sp. Ag1]